MEADVRKIRHDLLGQVNSLRLTATLLPMLEDGEAVEYLDSMVSSAESAIQLIDRLLPHLNDESST